MSPILYYVLSQFSLWWGLKKDPWVSTENRKQECEQGLQRKLVNKDDALPNKNNEESISEPITSQTSFLQH